MMNYYNGDYKAISGTAPMDAGVAGALGGDYRPLYNGNISSMGVNIGAFNNPLLYNYQYDQLNRLVSMDAWQKGSAWGDLTPRNDFQERVSYDPNGNILGYKRNGNTFAGKSLGMDSLNYNYVTGSNKLDHVSDNVPVTNYDGDIDSQSAGNYNYDAIGNLIKDSVEGDLANLLFLKELKKKMPGVPGLPDDVKGTYDMIKKKVKDEDLKNLLNASETIIKNRLDGMQMAKEGTLELVTNLIPAKKLGDALRLLDKTLLVAGLNPLIYDYNLAIVSHLDFQQTRLQFEFTVNMNAHLMKHDHLYILPVTYKQFCQIMSEKFVVLDDYKKQIGLRIYNDASNPDFQKANFGGEKPAFFLYFNKVGDKGFLHVSEMGVKPIQ